MTPEARFWRKVVKLDEGCWLWIGHMKNTYGSIYVNNREIYVHRYSYELAFGPIPDGSEVCHKCDEPKCVRPDHLFVGSHLKNIRDKVAKGRAARGEQNGRTLLTESDVRAIRDAQWSVTQEALASQYGVSRSCIKTILERRSWNWVT